MNQFTFKGRNLPVKAQVVGEHLSKLYKQHNKQLTKEHIVKDAAKQRSPIHACFEWDDKKAAPILTPPKQTGPHHTQQIRNCQTIPGLTPPDLT